MRTRALSLIALCLGVASLSSLALAPPAAFGVDLPSGFQDTTVIEGLQEPTALQFAADGRVFVAEKQGVIKVYDNLADETPQTFADLRTQVYDSGDRGLLSFVLDPEFPTRPYVYALYSHDAPIGGTAPFWGVANQAGDDCPDPPGSDTHGCVSSARLSRLTASGNHSAGEQVMIEDWCMQFSSHSIGDLHFDADGALYVSGGEGARFITSDWGQFGKPPNPCGDPPGGVMEAPTAEGGALRSQDLRTLADPTGLDGTIIRIDPDTGEGLPDNPMAASPDANARRIVAFGFRNPFRFTIHPETHEIYAGNVGWGSFEEMDRFAAAPSVAFNSGWPCFEGPAINVFYDQFQLCEDLYDEPGSDAPPFFSYNHDDPVVPGDPCSTDDGSAISGMAVYDGDAFPAPYEGALFFSDSVRGCVYVMFPGEDGRPDPSTLTPFMTDAGPYPGVDIEIGPGGNLYYVSIFSEVGGDEFEPGAVHRISYFSGNQPPVAHLAADKQWGDAPLEVEFDATGSTDADGEQLAYEWDLNGDGSFDLPTSDGVVSETYVDDANHTVAVRVSDEKGASSIARLTVYPDNTPPQPEILEPGSDLEWAVGQQIDFEGEAIDGEDGALPATSLDWSTRLFHCPHGKGCHGHSLRAFPAVDAGGFAAPDHDFPSHIELTLTAVDSRGLTAKQTVKIDPRTVELSISSDPPGVTIDAGLLSTPAPFALTSIEDSSVVLSAPASAQLGGDTYAWQAWSDGGGRVHTVVAGQSASYVATYSKVQNDDGGGAGDPPPPPKPKRPKRLKAPRTRIDRHPAKKTINTVARFAFSASEPGARFRCKLDKRPFTQCRSPRFYRNLKPGWRVFKVAAIGVDGKVDQTPASFGWRVLPPE